jgi:glycosyltransferase involved in cell wall biosynthesis
MPARRIVFISENPPYGRMNGGGLRTRVTLEALRTVGDVRYLPVIRSPWTAADVAETTARMAVLPAIQYDAVPASPIGRLRRHFDPRCMDTDGFGLQESDRAAAARVLADADLVWIHNVKFANILRRWRWPGAVLDIDDLPSRYERARATVLSGAARLRTLWRASLWRRRERRLGERFADVVVCSEEDRRHLQADCRVHVIPNTFDDAGITPARTSTTPLRFGFIGNVGYLPNQDGVEWFGRRVWPRIVRELPGAEFRLIGSGSDEFVRDRGLPGTALGYVDDPTEEMSTWTALIVPIRFGGGTRIKISEAFVRRLPVVSTRLGAFGYDVEDDRHALLADDPDGFARACVRLVRESGLVGRLTEAGAALYRGCYSPRAIRQRLVAVAEEALHHSARPVPGAVSC